MGFTPYFGYGAYFNYPYPAWIDPQPLVAQAGNVETTGGNPSYTVEDFYTYYEQFRNTSIPDVVMNDFVTRANATLQLSRWHENWLSGMANYIAHFATLFLQRSAGTNPSQSDVIGAGAPLGLDTAQSVGDLSVSTDYGAVNEDLKGWAQFKTTAFGQDFASMAEQVGRGGMLIY